jgi:ribosome-associated protein
LVCETNANEARGEELLLTDQESLTITPRLEIPLSEIQFRFSRSGGPGGQHVNRSETRVELLFDVASSPSLTDAERGRILERLDHVIDREGVLHLTSSESRSQHQNREAVIGRFRNLVQLALRPRKVRRPTRPSQAAVERRLDEKRRRSAKKRSRQRSEWA